ncbi:MAG: anthranilate synthase component I [Candidatus Cloacimonadota bacterium]|nr:MAG: anthranilate synthase component I [Candidatus Cloacimonadota bacterium]
MRMELKEFKDLAKVYNVVPVYQKVLADLTTPVAAYLKVAKKSKYSFLFESVEKGKYARFSMIGKNPKTIYGLKDEQSYILKKENEYKEIKTDKNYLDLLSDAQESFCGPILEDFPEFYGGLVGYLSYETVTLVEKIPVHKRESKDPWDAIYMQFDELIAFDHLKNQLIVFSNVHIDENINLEKAYNEAHKKIDQWGEDLHTEIDFQLAKKVSRSTLDSNFKKEDFIESVKKAKGYIQSGDVFQLVLSQKFHRKSQAHPSSLYRALRTINPSPYMFFMDFEDYQLIGASPELLVKVTNKKMEVRPIAGTRKRGKNLEEDELLAKDLLSDKKELAEHLMLVDLGRNDVGKVCEYGSVKLKEYMMIEKYSHVMHIVSDVEGIIKKDTRLIDALFSGFPAGTTSGAPKIRAMELINELEPSRRSIYSGCVGYFDYVGNLNTCIAIRTLLMQGEDVYFQAGAGIVYDSDPQTEYEETQNKAKAIMKAIDFAEDGLVS